MEASRVQMSDLNECSPTNWTLHALLMAPGCRQAPHLILTVFVLYHAHPCMKSSLDISQRTMETLEMAIQTLSSAKSLRVEVSEV